MQLLVLLLGEISSLTPQDLAGIGGDRLSKLLFSRMAERVDVHSTYLHEEDQETRLRALLEWLVDRDFQPEAEKLEDTVRIILHNCPFRLGALSDPNVCLFDQTIISRMLNVPVEQERCIRAGDQVCCYMARVKPQA